MKKLLGLLAATGLVASTGSAVVACGEDEKTDTTVTTDSIKGKVDALLDGKPSMAVAALQSLLNGDETIVEVATWTVSRDTTIETTANIGFTLAEGYTLVTGDDAEFTVADILTPLDTLVIELDDSDVELDLNGTSTKEFTIANFAELDSIAVAITSGDNAVEISADTTQTDGKFTIVAVAEGDATITVSSDVADVQPVTIDVDVIDSTELFEII
ncbi:hypothetical protein SCLARK_001625 [Spiroplasma clarkii]|uniref:Spiralin-like protein n=1 Tax=Spiroplasma clarkii TaxID=2139 RepID=A0A1Y0L341_9MOLU|nr:lipoprotein [Spiroplasma clarkii]ARU92099.1 hypothetical protein SCLARK_001625 [Spiroplasma clarkii]ATX71437.1 hypothetical protein SCLAR_v1c11370 [Spiroplasma clarkii]